MIDPLDYGFDGDLEPGRLDAEKVGKRLKRRIPSAEKRTTRLDISLGHLDGMAAELVPASRLFLGLRSGDTGEAAWLFGLGLGDQADRIRAAVGNAHRRAWQYADLVAHRLVDIKAADDFGDAMISFWKLHVALRRKFRDRPDKAAALNETMMVYFNILGASAFDEGDTSFSDLMHESGAGLGSLDNLHFVWLGHLEQVGISRSHVHFAEAFRLADLTGDMIVLIEENAAQFPDQSIVADLRAILTPELKTVALRRHRRPGVRTSKRAASSGVVELDAVDFFILQLAEVYAISFARPVPTYFDNRAERDGKRRVQRDKHFKGFLDAAAGVCEVQVGSFETRIVRWRRFPIVVEYLRNLTRFAQAAAAGKATPFVLDEDEHLVSSWVLSNAPNAKWAGG